MDLPCLPPRVPSHRGGQKRSAAVLGASSSNALLGPTKADTHTHAHAVSLLHSHGPTWPRCASPRWWADCSWGWPDLSGIWFHGMGERLRHLAIDARGTSAGMEVREAWGPGSAAPYRLRVRCHRLLQQGSDGPKSQIAATLFPRPWDFRLGFCFVKVVQGRREGGTCAFYKSCLWICPLG